MTASSSADKTPADRQKLPLWRAVAGFGLLGILAALLVVAGSVYLDNFRLDRYMREIAERPESAGLSDGVLKAYVVGFAHGLGLPVYANDIAITHLDGRPHIRIARYGVETSVGHMDLRMPEASSR